MLHPTTQLVSQRLRYLPRVKTPGGELEALLQATPRWQAQLAEDLALLHRATRKLDELPPPDYLSLIHISEPTRLALI
eukprot:1226432-Alexandrium_andersonii.AAC.1